MDDFNPLKEFKVSYISIYKKKKSIMKTIIWKSIHELLDL